MEEGALGPGALHHCGVHAEAQPARGVFPPHLRQEWQHTGVCCCVVRTVAEGRKYAGMALHTVLVFKVLKK